MFRLSFGTRGVDPSAPDEDLPAEFRRVRSQYLKVSAKGTSVEARLRDLLTKVADVIEREVAFE